MSRSAGGYVPQRGDVVRLSLDPTKGHEQRGSRPALVLSGEEYNRRTGLAVVCPVTNSSKGYPFEVAVPDGCGVTGVVLADQIRCVDWRERKAERMAELGDEFASEVVGFVLAVIDPDGDFGGDEDQQ